MDLKALRDEVIEATSRALSDRHGFVPSDESDEWENEYRRQYDLAKQRHATAAPTAARPTAAVPAAVGRSLPELTGGTVEQARWASTIREDRLQQIADTQIRTWLIRDWTRAKAWIDTRDIPPATFRARAQTWFAEARKEGVEKARIQGAERRNEAAVAAAIQKKVQAAGVTPEGLLELVDASERTEPAPLQEKLAEFSVAGRTLRVFATIDPNVLLVKEKVDRERLEYGIERDEGLVGDLKLFAQVL